MGVELPLCVVVTILECCVTFPGVKLSVRSFVLFIVLSLGMGMCVTGNGEVPHLD